MARKVFISFLGNSKYKECVYKDQQSQMDTGVVKYIQHGLVKLYCKNWTKEDKVFIFLTVAAAESNWQELYEHLNSLNYAVSIHPIFDVPEGSNETELWGIFEKVYYQLQPEDKIVFDITHSFRSLPMLGMVLSNYARFLLKTDVVRVCYGAFEKLGAAFNIDHRIPNPVDRIVPIVDLTSLVQLQKWTSAADIFINYGKGHRINELLNEPIEELNFVLNNFATSRGGQLALGNQFETLKNKMINLRTTALIKPFQPIIQKIENKIRPFETCEPTELNKMIQNTLQAVKWCIDHNLTQQGFTLLQEGIVTIVLTELGKDFQEKSYRNIASSCFTIWDKPQDKWKGEAGDQPELTQLFLQRTELFCKINSKRNPYFAKISIFRNDLNHAGYLRDAKFVDEITPKLVEYYNKVKTILSQHFA
jgi:CRISPR-associated DxTHG motif protein